MFFMYPHYYSGGFFGFGFFPVLLILGVIFLIWTVARHRNDNEEIPEEETALDILKKRFARGEITKKEFDQMKKDIE